MATERLVTDHTHDAEHRDEAGGDQQAHPQGPGDSDAGVVVGRVLDAEEVREVGREHGEAAGVERGDQAGGEGEGQRCVDHSSSASIRDRRSSAVSAPLCRLVMVPSAAMKTVVGMARPSYEARMSPPGSLPMS